MKVHKGHSGLGEMIHCGRCHFLTDYLHGIIEIALVSNFGCAKGGWSGEKGKKKHVLRMAVRG